MRTKKVILLFFAPLLTVITSWVFFRNESEGKQLSQSEEEQICIDKPVPIEPFFDQLIREYEGYINESMDESGVPAVAVAIVKGDSTLYAKGFGFQRSNTNDAIDINTVFRLASVSKGFAAVLTGTLVEDSLLHWQDKAIDYLPNFKLKTESHTKGLTIEHILSHTSGLPYHTYTNLIEEGNTLPEMIDALQNVKPITVQGKVYSYQNVIFSLISEIIFEELGCSYEDMLYERILQPLGMTNTSSSYEEIMDQQNVAYPHKKTKKGYLPSKITPKYYNAVPAGGLNASIKDMSNWLKLLMGNYPDIISKATLDTIFKPRVKTPLKWRYRKNWKALTSTQYALGWRIFDYGGDTIVYHGGYANNYRSEIAINRSNNIGVCILTSARCPLINKSVPTFLDLYRCYNNL